MTLNHIVYRRETEITCQTEITQNMHPFLSRCDGEAENSLSSIGNP